MHPPKFDHRCWVFKSVSFWRILDVQINILSVTWFPQMTFTQFGWMVWRISNAQATAHVIPPDCSTNTCLSTFTNTPLFVCMSVCCKCLLQSICACAFECSNYAIPYHQLLQKRALRSSALTISQSAYICIFVLYNICLCLPEEIKYILFFRFERVTGE